MLGSFELLCVELGSESRFMETEAELESLEVLRQLPILKLRLQVQFDQRAPAIYSAAEAWRGALRTLLQARSPTRYQELFAARPLTDQNQAGTRGARLLTPGYSLFCAAVGQDQGADTAQSLELTLFGRASVFAVDLVLALIQMGEVGIGLPRVPYTVHGLDVWHDEQWRPVNIPANENGLVAWSGSAICQADWESLRAPTPPDLVLRCLTPLKLTLQGNVVTDAPPFDLLLRASIERVLRIASTWAVPDLAVALARCAEPVMTQATGVPLLEVREGKQVARRQFDRHIGQAAPQAYRARAWLGSARYGQVPRTAMPWLIVGRSLGIGQNTTFGWGRYAVAWC
jgi:hypothetical protein